MAYELKTTERIKRAGYSPASLYDQMAIDIAEGRATEAEAGDNLSVLMTRGVTLAMTRAHDEYPAVYPQLTQQMASDGETETYAGVGRISDAEVIEDGEPVPMGSITTDRAAITNQMYALGMQFTEADLRRDRTGVLAQRASQVGVGVQRKKEKEALVFFTTTGPTVYDGDAFFANSHPNRTGSGANTNNDNLSIGAGALSESTVSAALTVLRGWQDYNSEPLDVDTELLLVANDQAVAAAQLVASTATTTSDKNEGVANIIGNLFSSVVRWPRLAAGDWFIKSNIPGLAYQVETAFRATREAGASGESFWRNLAAAYKGIEWSNFGVLDWRCWAKGDS